MTVKYTPLRAPPKLAAYDFPELNRKLTAAKEFCNRVCKENGLQKLDASYSFSTYFARREGSRILLNPFFMRLLDDREIAAVVGHEIGHAAQPERGVLARLFVQRMREYKADAFSTEATGDPDAMISVLGKKKGISFRIDEERTLLRLMHKLVGKITHPSEKKRIARLMELKERIKWEDMFEGSE